MNKEARADSIQGHSSDRLSPPGDEKQGPSPPPNKELSRHHPGVMPTPYTPTSSNSHIWTSPDLTEKL